MPVMTPERLIVVACTVPVTAKKVEGKGIQVNRSDGGLVTGMTPILKKGNKEGVWVGSLKTDKDTENEGLEEAVRTHPNGGYGVEPFLLTQEQTKNFYLGYSNEVIWPLSHGFTRLAAPHLNNEVYWNTYDDTNRNSFARKTREIMRPGDRVWIQDYQLLRTAYWLREDGVEADMGFFYHIPVAQTKHLARVPQKTQIMDGFMAHDLVGVQTPKDKDKLIAAAKAFGDVNATEDTPQGTVVWYGGRKVVVEAFPISIDAKEFTDQASSKETAAEKAKLAETLAGKVLIFDCGRLDYKNGQIQELQALDLLLKRHPELAPQISYRQLVVPSREDIPAYKRYKKGMVSLADAINSEHGLNVVEQLHRRMDRAELLANYGMADVMVVPSVGGDGMNLVSKEWSVVGKRNGVLALSEDTGAIQELYIGALPFNPRNTEQFAMVLEQALTMPQDEKVMRKMLLEHQVTTHDVFRWAHTFNQVMDDISHSKQLAA